MSGRFVRQSSYRHVYGNPAKKDKIYDNIRVSASAFDTNLVTVNPKYIAVNYQASGGGAFLVTPLEHYGKTPDLYPLARGHTAPVLDTSWNPFDDDVIASAGEDGKVVITKVDGDLLADAWRPKKPTDPVTAVVQDIEPTKTLPGHGRKVGHVLWHPTANNVLASASTDAKLWDVEAGQAKFVSTPHADMVQSLAWKFDGSVIATSSKDKKLRIFDVRGSPDAVTVVPSHPGVKGSRICWLNPMERLVTTGFSRTSERQICLWDARALQNGPLKTVTVDVSSGMFMPFYAESNKVLFVAGKGDGNIRYYEYDSADELHYLSEFGSNVPQRGMTFMPARGLNTDIDEIARSYKCAFNAVEPISFIVPRKSDMFQRDLYPPVYAGVPALSSEEFFAGQTKTPVLTDLETGEKSGAEPRPRYVPESVKEPASTEAAKSDSAKTSETPKADSSKVETPAVAISTPAAENVTTETPSAPEAKEQSAKEVAESPVQTESSIPSENSRGELKPGLHPLSTEIDRPRDPLPTPAGEKLVKFDQIAKTPTTPVRQESKIVDAADTEELERIEKEDHLPRATSDALAYGGKSNSDTTPSTNPDGSQILDLEKENAHLKAVIDAKNDVIADLESKLDKLKTSFAATRDILQL